MEGQIEYTALWNTVSHWVYLLHTLVYLLFKCLLNFTYYLCQDMACFKISLTVKECKIEFWPHTSFKSCNIANKVRLPHSLPLFSPFLNILRVYLQLLQHVWKLVWNEWVLLKSPDTVERCLSSSVWVFSTPTATLNMLLYTPNIISVLTTDP